MSYGNLIWKLNNNISLSAQKNFLEANHKQTLASLATVEEKNKALIEIFKKSILVGEATKSLAETIQQNIGGANQNIEQSKKMIAVFQEVLIQRLKNMNKEMNERHGQLMKRGWEVRHLG